jgi:hypothetical protein
VPWRRGDLIAAALLAVCAAAAVWAVPDSVPLRTVLALPLVLFAPGYTVAAALFPAWSLREPEHLLLAVALSLVTDALGGLALDVMQIRLEARSWVALIGAVTVAGVLLAAVRRATHLQLSRVPIRIILGRRGLGAVAVASLVLSGAVALARTPLPAPQVSGYTVLWLVPSSDRGSGVLELGASSDEQSAGRYRVELRVGGHTTRRWGIQLAPGQRWQVAVHASRGRPVEALLYRDHSSAVYRRVELPRG